MATNFVRNPPRLPRSWRNNNPGNVRTLSGSQKWQGQIDVDNAPGGPFAIFENQTMGFRALALVLRTYEISHNLRTVRQMLYRYAPPSDNNDTEAYVSVVARRMGVAADEVITLRHEEKAMIMLDAIARHEGGAHCPAWNREDMRQGWRMAWRL